MKQFYSVLIALIVSITVTAQSRLIYNQYMYNPEVYNPGFMNVENEFSATLLYRLQYLNQSSFPQNAYFNTSYHLHKNHGIGFTINNQNMNKFNQFEAGLNYTYHIWTNNFMAIGFGINANFFQQTLNPSTYNIKDAADPVIEHSRTINGVNLGTGISLQAKNLMVSLSLPRFFANGFANPDFNSRLVGTGIYLSGSYKIVFNKYFTLMPSALIRAAGGAPMNIMADINVICNESIIAGAGYKLGNSVHAHVGYKFDSGLRISYNFETAPFSQMTGLGTSHEIAIGFYTPFMKPGFDSRRVMKKNGNVKGMKVQKFKGSQY